MEYSNQKNTYLPQTPSAIPNTKMTAVDVVNDRLSAVFSNLTKAVERVHMIANKVAGAAPPSDKMGYPAAVSSCSLDWLNDIDRQLSDLDQAIGRLD